MPSYYLQEGFTLPVVERTTHSDEPRLFLDDKLHTYGKKENQLVEIIDAPNWIDAREQVAYFPNL